MDCPYVSSPSTNRVAGTCHDDVEDMWWCPNIISDLANILNYFNNEISTECKSEVFVTDNDNENC